MAFGGTAGFAAAGHVLNYFAVIWPALVFGILISAAVRAFVPAGWFARGFRHKPLNAQLMSGVAGAPLMLCSCCVAPVFSAVYARSKRLAPSLAVMLASPGLNPAALVLTFLLFQPEVALARMLMAAPAVFLAGIVIERLFPDHQALEQESLPEPSRNFGRSLGEVLVGTAPAIVIGVTCSMVLIEYLPKDLFASGSVRFIATIVSASIAVPLALPTFFEIPLALSILAAGGPAGAAAAMLFAGPIINLPSLLALARSTNWKIALALAGLVWAIAVAGGLALNQMT